MDQKTAKSQVENRRLYVLPSTLILIPLTFYLCTVPKG